MHVANEKLSRVTDNVNQQDEKVDHEFGRHFHFCGCTADVKEVDAVNSVLPDAAANTRNTAHRYP